MWNLMTINRHCAQKDNAQVFFFFLRSVAGSEASLDEPLHPESAHRQPASVAAFALTFEV